MVGCAAPFCTNSVAKGYTMKAFPRNTEQRALWAKNVGERCWGNGVKNWTPATTNSFLCEVHFAPEMWEPRSDIRKLKANAYPTIFGYFLKKKSIEDNVQQVVNVTECNILAVYPASCSNGTTESYQPIDNFQFDQLVNGTKKRKCQVFDDTSENNRLMICPASCLDGSNEKEKKRCKKLEDFIRKQQLQMIEMRKKMKILKNTIYNLKNKHSNNKYKKALESIFTDCQIKALFSKQRCVRTWSHDTIKRALQLKFVCGTNGYKELIHQGYPLPNIRTLQRRIEDFQLQPGISEQMLEFQQKKEM